MKTRPIIFSGPMVRAILDGRKTQTRRVMKPQPSLNHLEVGCCLSDWHPFQYPDGDWNFQTTHEPDNSAGPWRCPYGRPGERLWARETFRLTDSNDCACYEPCRCRSGVPMYRADQHEHDDEYKWRPSIHMPRWASRITLAVKSVRVERLQDISEEDAEAEGIESCYPSQLCGLAYRDYALKNDDPFEWYGSPISSFRSLWQSIHGPDSWDANPFVWVIEFEPVNTTGSAE